MYPNLFAQPPYLLLLLGILISVSCGTAFQKVLKQNVQQWYRTAKEEDNPIETKALFFPFIGICAGIFVFLAGGLQIVANNWTISNAISLPLSLLTGRLVWSQLQVLLVKLQEGGSKAIDLDNIF